MRAGVIPCAPYDPNPPAFDTAAASAGVYLHRGWILPELAFPIVLGVLAGALTGARILAVAPVRPLRILFTVVVVILAAQMLYKGATGGL